MKGILWQCEICENQPVTDKITTPVSFENKMETFMTNINKQMNSLILAISGKADKKDLEDVTKKVTDIDARLKALESKPSTPAPMPTAWNTDNPYSPAQKLEDIVRGELDEREEIQSRKMNLIITKVRERTVSPEEDKQHCSKIFEYLGVEAEIEQVTRLGQEDKVTKTNNNGDNKSIEFIRPIKVTFTHQKHRKLLLARATQMRANETPKEYSHVYIRPDLTAKQLTESKNLQDVLAKTRMKEPEKRWKIFRGRIIEVQQGTGHQKPVSN